MGPTSKQGLNLVQYTHLSSTSALRQAGLAGDRYNAGSYLYKLKMTQEVKQTPLELQVCLSAAVLPLLSGVVALATLGQQVRELGEVSEEVFRGDRLPVLPFPD